MPTREQHLHWLSHLLPHHRAHVETLALPPAHWPGLGLVPPAPECAALAGSFADHPHIRQMLEVGAPDAFDLSNYSGGNYDQGQTPECSSHSAVTIKSYEERIRDGGWFYFDPHLLFREGGGTSQGGNMESMAQVCQTTGALRTDTHTRYKIQSWLKARTDAAGFVEDMKAAIAANKPCQLAVLLPTNFSWSSSGSATQGYHALAAVGYDSQWLIVQNSWGAGWGNRGFGRLLWSYLTGANFPYYNYGLCWQDVGAAPGPAPIPTPAPVPTPVPAPTPSVPRISGHTPEPVSRGGMLTIHGSGFGTTTGQVGMSAGPSGQNVIAPVQSWGDTQAGVTVPMSAITGSYILVAGSGRYAADTVTVQESAPVPIPVPVPTPRPVPVPTPDFAGQVLALTNQQRAAAGLAALVFQSQLQQAAQGYAQVLATNPAFSHTGPDGSTPFSRMKAAGYQGGTMGENIARGFAAPQDVMTAWMNSPGHQANLLYPAYTQIGIGVANGPQGESWVQDFGAGGSVTPTPTPTPVPVPVPIPVPVPVPIPVPIPTPIPVPVPVPTPPPPPVPIPTPGALAVVAEALEFMRTSRLTVTVTGNPGEAGTATIDVASAAAHYPGRSVPLGARASWYLWAPTGTVLYVTARTPDGRQGQASVTVHW